MSCFVMRPPAPPRSPPPSRGPVVPISACCRSTAFRPPPSVRAAGRPVRRDPVSRVSPACPRASAPARFARLIAPALARQTQGAPLPPVPPGSFRTDARRSGLRTPLPCLETQYISIFLDIKPFGEQFLNILQIQRLAGAHPGPFLAIPPRARHMRCDFPHRRPA